MNLADFHPAFDQAPAVKTVAAVLILGFGPLNYRSIKLGAWAINSFTLAKLVPSLLPISPSSASDARREQFSARKKLKKNSCAHLAFSLIVRCIEGLLAVGG